MARRHRKDRVGSGQWDESDGDAGGGSLTEKKLGIVLVKFRQMAEQKPRPFEATELDIISKAQAIACPDEDDVMPSSKALGRLQLKLSPIVEHEPGQPRCHAAKPNDSSYSLCSVDKYDSRLSSTTESLTSTYPPDTGDDCAGIVLTCLFCRFYDLCLMLPSSCDRATQRLFPSYHHFATTAEPVRSNGNNNNCGCNCNCEFDCGLFDACHDTGECLELAMEISEVCYH